MSLKDDKNYPDKITPTNNEPNSTTDDETISITLSPSPSDSTFPSSPPSPPRRTSLNTSLVPSYRSPLTHPQHIRNLTITTAILSTMTAISLVSPITLILLTLSALSSTLTLTTMYSRIRSDGLLPILPPALIAMLTQEMTIDEFLRPGDPGFIAQWQFLAIYFVPGLDIDTALQALPARRRAWLTKKRTWGRILGIERLLQEAPLTDIPPALEWDDDHRSRSVSSRDEIDSLDIEIDVTDTDLTGGMTDREMRWFSSRFLNLDGKNARSQGRGVPSPPVQEEAPPPSPGSEGEGEEGGPSDDDLETERSLVTRLFSDYFSRIGSSTSLSVNQYISNAISSTTLSIISYAQNTINTYSPLITTTGWSVMAFSTIGLFGMGSLRPPGRQRVWLGAIFGAGIMSGSGIVVGNWLIRYGLAVLGDRHKPDSNSKKDEQKVKKE